MMPSQRDKLCDLFEAAYFRPHRWPEERGRSYLEAVIPRAWPEARREAVMGKIATVAAAVSHRPSSQFDVDNMVYRCMDAVWIETGCQQTP